MRSSRSQHRFQLATKYFWLICNIKRNLSEFSLDLIFRDVEREMEVLPADDVGNVMLLPW